MMTYCESNGQEPFNWWKALNETPLDNNYQWTVLHEKAGKWITCACGNQCSSLPRAAHGVPLDNVLASLGVTFSVLVYKIKCRTNTQTWKSESPKLLARAKEVLQMIEHRSDYLLNRDGKPIWYAIRNEKSGQHIQEGWNFQDMHKLYHTALDGMEKRWNPDSSTMPDYASKRFCDALMLLDWTLEFSETPFTQLPTDLPPINW
ncbi:hypothetical protein GCM10028806_33230 [Spirosoma terrae]|uniref:Uncharacterized protein n=1 Tax=Spirosoma terrae TaxID=1968276 RepID=A0A6L9L835_9BACT|nr:hypothetical protein [Spirosoma terrae]NDU95637.1 hypothetical protein [Spirosoma terrae]